MDIASAGTNTFDPPSKAPHLPNGVLLTPLALKPDSRGSLTEIFRQSWETGISPVQWNAVHSASHVMRGFHLHSRHSDYLLLLSGRMLLALRDLRPDSSTHGLSIVLDLKGSSPAAVTIPPGVGHAFYFPEPSFHIYAVDEYWHQEDELGCRWDDETLELPWSIKEPLLSERDEKAGTCKQMVDDYLRQKSRDAKKA